jgi:CHAT domain-containing protein
VAKPRTPGSVDLRQELLRLLPRLRHRSAQAKYLAKHHEILNSETVSWLADAVRDQAKVDTSGAFRLAEIAVVIAGRLKDKFAQGRAFRAMGNALYGLGKNKDAAAYHEKARKIFSRIRNRKELARTLSASIQPLILVGKYNRAFENAQQAGRLFEVLGDQSHLARLELNIGNIFHRQDRFDAALLWYQRAHSYFSSGADADPEAMGVILHNIAVCLVSLNDFHRALATHQEARAVAQKNNMPRLVGQADYNIAALYYLRGEYSRAVNLLLATREACRKSNDHYHVALCQLDLSEIYLELNLSRPAEEMAREASAGFQRLEMGYEAGKSLVNLALAMARQNKSGPALEMLAEARQQFIREENRVWPSLTDLYRAVIMTQQERFREARRLCLSANKFFRTAHIPNKLVFSQLLRAQLDLSIGKVQAAARACSGALTILKKIELPALTCQALQLMGRIHLAAGRTNDAYNSYESARRLLEATRSGLRNEEMKISFMEGKLEIYEGLVEICLESPDDHDLEEAFAHIEQSKSRSLQDLVSVGEGSTSNESSEAQRQALDLRAEITWYSRKLDREQLRRSSKRPSNHLSELQEAIRQRENELLRLAREMPTPEAEAIGLSSSEPATLQQIRDSLLPDSTLVEYFQIRDRFLAATLTQDTLQIRPVAGVQNVTALLQKLEFQLAKFRLGAAYVSTFGDSLLQTTQQHLKELHDELLAPVREHLKGQHLVIVPHGILHRLPFQALFDGREYLIDEFSISYAPSATIHSLCYTRPVSRDGPSLVMGIPDAVAPLILDEATAVASVIPEATLYLGKKATAEILRKEGVHSRWIHIATHGYVRHDSPMFSGIRLGDSMLSLYDLYRLKLPAELVTLSGCSTGVSTVAGGDELLGLVRGLIYAGARAALLTLWDVQDRSTQEFMTAFYGHLALGVNKAAALQKAVWNLRQQYPHPYHWAPFRLVGNTSS